MEPVACGEVPAKSALSSSPAMVTRTRISIGSGRMPSPSMKSEKLHEPSGNAAISARVRRSVWSMMSVM